MSGKSHAKLWPSVAEWFAERSVLDDDAVSIDIETDDVDEDAPVDTAVQAENGTADVVDGDEDEEFDDTDLDQVDGVGPAYAERLEAAGIGTVSELAAADPDELAERIDVSASRVADWVAHATELTS